MALIFDNGYYNHDQVSNHDHIMSMCAQWVDHYNFMASIPWNTKAEQSLFEEEMTEYLCYDV